MVIIRQSEGLGGVSERGADSITGSLVWGCVPSLYRFFTFAKTSLISSFSLGKGNSEPGGSCLCFGVCAFVSAISGEYEDDSSIMRQGIYITVCSASFAIIGLSHLSLIYLFFYF